MKQWAIFFCVFLCAQIVVGQIILEPAATGSRIAKTELWCWLPAWPTTYSIVGRSCSVVDGDVWDGSYWNGYHHGTSANWYLSFKQGIFEFNLQNTFNGNDFPPDWMTPYNWTAQITNLVVQERSWVFEDAVPGVALYDLMDSQQDGEITCSDIETGPYLELLSVNRPAVGQQFSADVTDSLRHDIFGPTRYTTSGFILQPPEPTWGFRSGERWSNGAQIVVNPSIETPTPSPTPTSTPIPSPTEPCDTGVSIQLSQDLFRPGDTFQCSVTVCNDTGVPLSHYPLFIVLDVGGELFFGPSFSSEFQSYLTLYPGFNIGRTEIDVIPSFPWPDCAGSFYGAGFYACLTDRNISEVIGEFGSTSFGWTE